METETTSPIWLLVVVLIASVAMAEGGLELEIVARDRDELHEIRLAREGDHFHVILTNAVDHELRIWEEWNSWGWACLFFEVLDEDGSIAEEIRRDQPRCWTVKFPSWQTLEPGESWVFDVTLDPTEWGHDLCGGPNTLFIRPVYEVPADDQTAEHGIITGRFEGEPLEVTIHYYLEEELPLQTNSSGQRESRSKNAGLFLVQRCVDRLSAGLS